MTQEYRAQLEQELTARRERIVRTLLIGLAALGLVAYVPSMWLSLRVGATAIAVLDTVVYVALLAMVYFGGGRTRLQSGFLIAVVYVLGLALGLALGPAGAGPLWLAMVPAFTAVLFDRTRTYVALGVVIATAAAVAGARAAGWIHWSEGPDSVALWLVMAGNGILVGGALGLAVSTLVRGLRTLVERNARVTAELDRERDRLLEANRRLQEEATERRSAEAQLRQAEKRKALGALAAGIAHDFNNLLTPVLAAPELLRDPLPDSDRERILEQVESAAFAGRALVHRILAFSRPSGEGRRPLDAAAALRDAVRLLRASLPAAVSLDLEIQAETSHVMLTPAVMHQLVLNHVSNAQKAMPDGGCLVFRLDEVDGEAAPWDDGPAPERVVRLDAIDTGVGMGPETVRRIFDPFFTTNQDTGTGMGLATVHGIVHSAGGTVRCDSAPGQGTTLSIFLPVVDADSDAEAATASPAAPAPAGIHVLLAEDEEPVRDVSARALRRAGYTVTAVGDAEAALEALDRDPAVRALITDLNMPGMKGTALARAVKHRRPGVGVVLMTGLVDEPLEQEARAIGIERIVAKPFRIDELGTALAEVLDRSAAP